MYACSFRIWISNTSCTCNVWTQIRISVKNSILESIFSCLDRKVRKCVFMLILSAVQNTVCTFFKQKKRPLKSSFSCLWWQKMCLEIRLQLIIRTETVRWFWVWVNYRDRKWTATLRFWFPLISKTANVHWHLSVGNYYANKGSLCLVFIWLTVRIEKYFVFC